MGLQHSVESRNRLHEKLSKRRGWRLRLFQPGDESQILALRREVFNEDLSVDEWRWRNLNNPAGAAIVVLAEELSSGKIIGCQSIQPLLLKVGRGTCMAYLLVDSMVSQFYRGRGLHASLSIEVIKQTGTLGKGFPFGFPNPQAYSSVKKLGGFQVTTLDLYVRVFSVEGVFREALGRRFGSLGKLGAKMLSPLLQRLLQALGRDRRASAYASQEIFAFDEAYQSFWNEIESQFSVTTVRSREFLNWRYFRSSSLRYRVFEVRVDGRVLAYLVTRTFEKKGLKIAAIADFICDERYPDAGRTLLTEFCQRQKTEKADLGIFMGTWPSGRGRSAFFRIPQKFQRRPFHLVADFDDLERTQENFREGAGKLLRDGSQWHLCLGDSDLI
jgi:hypothetical protein